MLLKAVLNEFFQIHLVRLMTVIILKILIIDEVGLSA